MLTFLPLCIIVISFVNLAFYHPVYLHFVFVKLYYHVWTLVYSCSLMCISLHTWMCFIFHYSFPSLMMISGSKNFSNKVLWYIMCSLLLVKLHITYFFNYYFHFYRRCTKYIYRLSNVIIWTFLSIFIFICSSASN